MDFSIFIEKLVTNPFVIIFTISFYLALIEFIYHFDDYLGGG